MRSRKWNIVTHLPDFASEAPRAYHAVVYVNSYLYFIGGYDGTNYYDKVRRYNVAGRTWDNCSRMYKRRCYVSAAYLDVCDYILNKYYRYKHMPTQKLILNADWSRGLKLV